MSSVTRDDEKGKQRRALGEAYLRERGVLESTFTSHGGEIDSLLSRSLIAKRLNRHLDERGIAHIRWVQAVAEDLPEAAPGSYRLITFGQSFHWTDEARVAEALYDMLEPDGALALIVHTVEDRPAPPSPGPPPIPHAEIKALVEKYLGSTRRAGQGVSPVRNHRFEDVLVRTRFGVPRSIFIPGIPDLLRDSESVLSGYFSMSSSAPHLFGDRAEDFAAEVRELLASRSPEGVFWDWPGDTEVILARKTRVRS